MGVLPSFPSSKICFVAQTLINAANKLTSLRFNTLEVFMKSNPIYLGIWVFSMIFFLCISTYARTPSPTQPHGQGSLLVYKDNIPIDIPLQHTDVKMSIIGFVASVDVEQTFANPYQENITATYIFPLPSTSAVDKLEMKIGERIIYGNIAQRQKAETEFNQASQQGYKAALLEQERPNVFTITVANIEPSNEIIVRLHYTQRLFYDDGTFRISFPMVVMPRYIPPIGKQGNGTGFDTDRDASRINPPNIDSGSRVGDVSISVDLNPGMTITDVNSPSHNFISINQSGDHYQIELPDKGTIPNKDFVLEYKIADNEPKGALFQAFDKLGQGYFLLMTLPPTNLTAQKAYPKEMILIIDISGSMAGTPLQQAKKALITCLAGLNSKDTFNIIAFEGNFKPFFENSIPATKENIALAADLVSKLEEQGGTEILAPLMHVLKKKENAEKNKTTKSSSLKNIPIAVVFSDGGIGNEKEVLQEVKQNLGKTRIFTFGIGSAVNEYFMRKLAQVGRGTAEFLLPEQADFITNVARFQKRISGLTMVDLSFEWPGSKMSDISPNPLPDIMVDQPIFITGKFLLNRGTPTLTAKSAKESIHNIPIQIDAQVTNVELELLSSLWARARLEDFTDMLIEDPNNQALQEQILNLALKYNLLSPVTAFVATDSSSSASNGPSRQVTVPVLLPESWEAGHMLLSAKLSSPSRPLQAPKNFTVKQREKSANNLLPNNPINKNDVANSGLDLKNQNAVFEYIMKKQLPTGQWKGNTTVKTLRTTALATLVMLIEGSSVKEYSHYYTNLVLASDYLFSNIDGFGRLYSIEGTNQETETQAIVFLALTEMAKKAPQLTSNRLELLNLVKERLLSLRSKSGLWYDQEFGQENTSATIWAILALDSTQSRHLASSINYRLENFGKNKQPFSIDKLLIEFWKTNKLSKEQLETIKEQLGNENKPIYLKDETFFMSILLRKIDIPEINLKEKLKNSNQSLSNVDLLALHYLIMQNYPH